MKDNTVLLKLNPSMSHRDIERFFYSKCHNKVLVLDVSDVSIISSNVIGLILENKERIWITNPSDRIIILLKMLSVLSLIKIEKQSY